MAASHRVVQTMHTQFSVPSRFFDGAESAPRLTGTRTARLGLKFDLQTADILKENRRFFYIEGQLRARCGYAGS